MSVSVNGNQMMLAVVLLLVLRHNSSRKGQWCWALMFSLICAWIHRWVNNQEAGDLWRHHTHYDVTVMCSEIFRFSWCCGVLVLSVSSLYRSWICMMVMTQDKWQGGQCHCCDRITSIGVDVNLSELQTLGSPLPHWELVIYIYK